MGDDGIIREQMGEAWEHYGEDEKELARLRKKLEEAIKEKSFPLKIDDLKKAIEGKE